MLDIVRNQAGLGSKLPYENMKSYITKHKINFVSLIAASRILCLLLKLVYLVTKSIREKKLYLKLILHFVYFVIKIDAHRLLS